MTVLILGNGLSRLDFDKKIKAFRGPVWGCNNIYLDYGPVLDRIAGHDWCMADAIKVREKMGYSYKILGGLNWSGDICEDEFTCKPCFRENTGASLVAEALTRGHKVVVCGFDMGGTDVYSKGHEKRNKTVWVSRWRLIFEQFNPDLVTFWGYDHKPFLLGNEPANTYAKKYLAGESHIPDKKYEKALESWDGDYSRVLSRLPMVYLKNIGKREWKFTECDELLRVGRSILVPEEIAKKYMAAYKKEFAIEPVGLV